MVKMLIKILGGMYMKNIKKIIAVGLVAVTLVGGLFIMTEQLDVETNQELAIDPPMKY